MLFFDKWTQFRVYNGSLCHDQITSFAYAANFLNSSKTYYCDIFFAFDDDDDLNLVSVKKN